MYVLLLLIAVGYVALLSRSVFVLTYHSIGLEKTNVPGLVISADAFRRQLKLLARLGFRAESLDTVLHEMTSGKARGFPRLCITFDDGYRTVLENAAPVLRSMNWPATLFVPTAYVGRTNEWDGQRGVREMPLLTWDELGTLSTMGIQIGSHGRTHRSLLKLPDEECYEELRGSLMDLDARLSRISRIFCYPFGHREPRMYALAQRAGYLGACSLVHDTLCKDRYDLGRLIVRTGSLPRFAAGLALYPLATVARRLMLIVRR